MITFLQINLMLALTYLFFWGIQKVEGLLKLDSSPKAFLRCAQLLIILSLVSPLLVKMMPIKQLPINQSTFRVFEEHKDSNFKSTKLKINSFAMNAPEKVTVIENSISVDYKIIFLSLWMLGTFYFSARFFKNYFKLRKLLSESVLFKTTKKLRIVVSDSVNVPFSVRMFKFYWVVLPVALLSNRTDFSLALKHELQHHRQGDTLWAVVIEILACILFFNPIIYLWKNTIIELQEFSCDEALTGQEDVLSHDYGSCLLRVAETALINRQVYSGTTSMAVVFKNSKYFKTFLLRRIEMIVKERKSSSKWIPVCTALALSALTLSLAYGVEKISRAKFNKANTGIAVVDSDIQKIADEALEKAMKESKSVAGFVIVSDPMTGKILAIANADKKHTKGHWALSQIIEPASFAKTFIIAKAIEENATTPNEIHQCENGQYKYKGKTYRDWKNDGWKQLTTAETLAISSNICSLKIGEKIGNKSLEEMFKTFGFGEDGTAADFPEAKMGEVPASGDEFIPKLALGYGFRISPLEIMQAYGAIANGGNLMKPIMANSTSPEVIRRILSPESAQKMKSLLQGVVLTGTGKNKATSSFYTTAGKTASARLTDYMNINWYGSDKHANFAGFVGFAPVNHPRVQVLVGMINPNTDKSGAHGGEHAAPVFKEVAENVLAYMKVAPDKL